MKIIHYPREKINEVLLDEILEAHLYESGYTPDHDSLLGIFTERYPEIQHLWVARNGLTPIGVAVIHEDAYPCFHFYVAPAYRRHGIGTKLLDAACNQVELFLANYTDTSYNLLYRYQVPTTAFRSSYRPIPPEFEIPF